MRDIVGSFSTCTLRVTGEDWRMYVKVRKSSSVTDIPAKKLKINQLFQKMPSFKPVSEMRDPNARMRQGQEKMLETTIYDLKWPHNVLKKSQKMQPTVDPGMVIMKLHTAKGKGVLVEG